MALTKNREVGRSGYPPADDTLGDEGFDDECRSRADDYAKTRTTARTGKKRRALIRHKALGVTRKVS